MRKGDSVLIMTPLYHYAGIVEECVPGLEVRLSSARIVYETGPWEDVAKGKLKTSETLPAEVTVSLIGGAWLPWTPR